MSDALEHLRDHAPGLQWSVLTFSELPSVAGLVSAIEHVDNSIERHDLAYLQQLWDGAGGLPMAVVGRDRHGNVVAWAWDVTRPGDVSPRTVRLMGGVHPAWRDKDVGTALVAWQVEAARDWDAATRRPYFGPLQLTATIEAKLDGARELFRSHGLTKETGIAPGPANGFAIDMAYCIENFHEHISSAMIILNPMEPWPGRYVLPIANEFGVDILARVVDFGGIFHDDVKPGHFFKDGDHRTYRPAGWIEHGNEKLEKMRPIAEKYGLTMLQFACAWNLSQAPVKSVGPTFMQEAGEPLRLKYVKAPYGPYAENLRHVLRAIEGHLVAGYADEWVGDSMKVGVSFIIILGVLLIRPSGLFGTAKVERV